MTVRSARRSDTDRDIAGVQELGDRVQLFTGQQQMSEALWTDSLLTCRGLDPVPAITVIADRTGPQPAVILSGTATIVEEDGTSFEVGPGTLFVTPAGWTGTWTVHETLRKMWVVTDLPQD
ncbi:cupin domain-containing protein [Paenarthrobacter nitroguajacolicus]|uniref:cupin domain-containing protein n=1 Tax=Paenarthrobacter nitroguajacolicus TaxID=211146 RepID=UPI001FCA87E9|nr:cupin domain-containing protein [Paenarthrobacter nitroguajacolicus]